MTTATLLPRRRDWRTMLVRMGRWRAILVITAFSVTTSVGVTGALYVLLNQPPEGLAVALAMGAMVPAVVAPAATHFFVQLLYELEAMRAELELLATRDALTQVHNRRYFMDALKVEIERSLRTGEPLSVVLLDADHFKAINDGHGHSTGDRVLQEIARAVSGDLRPYDVFARYGGEEFAALLPGVPLADACITAERMRAAAAALRIETAAGGTTGVTISLGVSSLGTSIQGPRDPSGKGLLERADAALYKAKHGGRNRWAC